MNLTTVPTFTFPQGDPFSGEDTNIEYPVTVEYYDGGISFEQNGNSVVISYEHAKTLFRETMKHIPEAKRKLGIKD